MIDTYVEKLCNPTGGAVSEELALLRVQGRVRARWTGARTATAAAAPAALRDRPARHRRRAHRPRAGVWRAASSATSPVAVSRKRSTYMRELDPAVSILKMNRNEARPAKKFVKIFRESHNLSTNWSLHLRRRDRLRARRAVPAPAGGGRSRLPGLGDGRVGVGRRLPRRRARCPHQVNPKRDFFVSWNNRPAPGWGAQRPQWGHSVALPRPRCCEDAINGRAEAARSRRRGSCR